MTKIQSLAVYFTNRSEEHLIMPVIRRLEKKGINVKLNAPPLDIDLAIAPFDRPYVVQKAVDAFYAGIQLAQVHAGDISSGSFDDRGRWVITSLASMHFCNSHQSWKRAVSFLNLIGKSPKHVYYVGSTALDDVVIDYSLRPQTDYGVVLYNPPTPLNPAEIDADLVRIRDLICWKISGTDLLNAVIWVGPNGDPGSDGIAMYGRQLFKEKVCEGIYLDNISHEKFLGLISGAKWMAGNSSSMYLEATHWKIPILQIGRRNASREPVDPEPGASDKIADTIANVDIEALRAVR